MITATSFWHWCQMTRWISCTRSQTSLERERNGSESRRKWWKDTAFTQKMSEWYPQHAAASISVPILTTRWFWGAVRRFHFCKCGTFQEYHRNYFFILTATVIAFGLFQAYERRVQHILLCWIIHHNYGNAPPEEDVLETSQMCWTDSAVRFFRRRIVRSKATRSSKVTPVHLEEMWHCCTKKMHFQIQPNHDHRRSLYRCIQREIFSFLVVEMAEFRSWDFLNISNIFKRECQEC